jgi:hypothetical protein
VGSRANLYAWVTSMMPPTILERVFNDEVVAVDWGWLDARRARRREV